MELSERARELLGPKPAITPDQFLKELWPLKKKGNVENAYIQTSHAIAFKKTFEGKPITLSLIVEKYRLYIEEQKQKNTEEKYILGIESFVAKGHYNMEFEKTVSKGLSRFLGKP